MRTCPDCGEDKPLDEFYTARRQDGTRRPTRCKACHKALRKRWREENREARVHYERNWNFQKQYGITLEEYHSLLAGQRWRCAICGAEHGETRADRLQVDHSHETGAVRGLLCGSCNRTLGAARDDPDRLRAAIGYLLRFDV